MKKVWSIAVVSLFLVGLAGPLALAGDTEQERERLRVRTEEQTKTQTQEQERLKAQNQGQDQNRERVRNEERVRTRSGQVATSDAATDGKTYAYAHQWRYQNYVDADGDGICDRYQYRNAYNYRFWRGNRYQAPGDPTNPGGPVMRGRNFVDANGDGVCDRYQSGGSGGGGTGGDYRRGRR